MLKLDTNSSFFRYGASIVVDAINQNPVFSHIYRNPQCSLLLYPSQNVPPSMWDQVWCIQIECWFNKTTIYSYYKISSIHVSWLIWWLYIQMCVSTLLQLKDKSKNYNSDAYTRLHIYIIRTEQGSCSITTHGHYIHVESIHVSAMLKQLYI